LEVGPDRDAGPLKSSSPTLLRAGA